MSLLVVIISTERSDLYETTLKKVTIHKDYNNSNMKNDKRTSKFIEIGGRIQRFCLSEACNNSISADNWQSFIPDIRLILKKYKHIVEVITRYYYSLPILLGTWHLNEFAKEIHSKFDHYRQWLIVWNLKLSKWGNCN